MVQLHFLLHVFKEAIKLSMRDIKLRRIPFQERHDFISCLFHKLKAEISKEKKKKAAPSDDDF